jgi:GNAT superfamily N-acetyltransferase
MDVPLRVANLTDALAVDDLLLASYSVLPRSSYDPDVLDAALPLMTRANQTLLSSGTYYVVEGPGRLSGCGGWSFERPGTGERIAGLAHIRHFAVHPEDVGQGIGRTLYEVCAAEAREHGARRFECFSFLNAERFYKGLGFRSVRPIEVRMGPGVMLPAVLMERDLEDSSGAFA